MDIKTSDSLLWEIAGGNTDALSILYEQKAKFVFFVALGIVNDWQIAEDVTQEVFIRIKKNAPLYKKGTNADGWLFVMTKHLAQNVVKKRKRETVDRFDEYNISGAQDLSGAGELYDVTDSIMLKNAMNDISKIERQIVLMYVVVGLSQKEISKLMNLPLSTVNWKYRSGISKLNQIMRQGEKT